MALFFTSPRKHFKQILINTRTFSQMVPEIHECEDHNVVHFSNFFTSFFRVLN